MILIRDRRSRLWGMRLLPSLKPIRPPFLNCGMPTSITIREITWGGAVLERLPAAAAVNQIHRPRRLPEICPKSRASFFAVFHSYTLPRARPLSNKTISLLRCKPSHVSINCIDLLQTMKIDTLQPKPATLCLMALLAAAAAPCANQPSVENQPLAHS